MEAGDGPRDASDRQSSDAATVADATRATRDTSPPPIAIVGIGCQYPGVRGPRELWQLVAEGRSSVGPVPASRIALGFDVDHFLDQRPRMPGRISSPLAGFIERPDLFDPTPFGLTARDAAAMEPQHRMLLEATWDAVEDAGIRLEALRGERLAVIVGHIAEDYSRERIAVLGEDAAFRRLDVRNAIGFSRAVLSGRISHLLGVTGPSLTLDTACSSSLYATHLACQSIWRGESRMGLVGGVNLFLTAEGGLSLSRSGMMSSDGKCKAFDARADGFVRAEGAGMILLRPLADAIADGDRVYAVIRGTGVSSDGRDGGHMMAPGRTGQAQAMHDAYAQACLSPCEIDYVETHGTGTPIGDPVEIGALADVMGPGRPADQPLRVASVKGNIGHTESASGVAGLIKAALMIHHREIPAQLHFETPSPQIPWDEIPIRVQTEHTPWPHSGVARVGVNSFGISGTNAHVILESGPGPEARRDVGRARGDACLVALTAYDGDALRAAAKEQLDALRSAPRPPELADLAHTLGARRTMRTARLSVVASSVAELTDMLDMYSSGSSASAPGSGMAGAISEGMVSAAGSGPLTFAFPGQGGQWLGMGRDLLESEPEFARAIGRWDDALGAHVDWSLMDVLRGRGGADSRLLELGVLQPSLVAFQVALADLYSSWGVVPDAVLGQSVGELAAATVAGVLDIEETARIVSLRGRLVERVSGQGAMGLIEMDADTLRERLGGADGRVEVAGENGPRSTLVAGDCAPLERLLSSLECEGHFARRLEVDFASHCFHMDPLLDEFRAGLGDLAPRDVETMIYSTVDGAAREGHAYGADHWVRNLRQAVRLAPAVEAALEWGTSGFLEISPHPTLTRPIVEIAAAKGRGVRTVASLRRDESGRVCLLRSLGALFTAGHAVDMQRVNGPGRIVPTPLYPYQRRSHWFANRRRADCRFPSHPLLGLVSHAADDPSQRRWETLIDADASAAALLGTRGARSAIAPGLFVEMALAVAEQSGVAGGVHVEDFALDEGARCPSDASKWRVQAVLQTQSAGDGALRIFVRDLGQDGAPWRVAARASIGGELSDSEELERSDSSTGLDALRSRYGDDIGAADLYAELARGGLDVSRGLRAVRGLHELRSGRGDELLVRLELPPACQNEVGHHHMPPVFFEAAASLAGSLLAPDAPAPMARAFERLVVRDPMPDTAWCRIVARVSERADAFFYSESGESLARLEGLRVGRQPLPSSDATLHDLVWQPVCEEEEQPAEAPVHWLIAGTNRSDIALVTAALDAETQTWDHVDVASLVDRLHEAPSSSVEQLRVGVVFVPCSAPEESESQLQGASLSGAPEIEPGLQVLAALQQLDDALLVRCALVTRGMQRLPGDPEARAAVSKLLAGAWGAAGPRFRTIDLALTASDDEVEQLAKALCAGRMTGTSTTTKGGDRELALRGGVWHAPRLVPREPDSAVSPWTIAGQRAVAGERTFAARLLEARADVPGDLGGEASRERPSSLCEIAAPTPGPGEVTVQVRAAGISQRDVRAMLGLDAGLGGGLLGGECAGVVSAVGEGVTGLARGDVVAGLARGAVASAVVTRADLLATVPTGLSFEMAASLPLSFVVSEIALQDLAHVGAGDRVLIHPAGGGVGMAAVETAHRRGARVMASAGDAHRRAALRARGAECVIDSRDPELARMVSSWAGEGGLDVVLCASDGPTVETLIDLLAPGGRLVDLRHSAERSGGPPRTPANRAWLPLELEEWCGSGGRAISVRLERIFEAVASGGLRPPPSIVFPVSEVSRALRYAAQGRHVGKVCLDLSGAHGVPIAPSIRSASGRLDGRANYVISGSDPAGILENARWLLARGVQRLVVVPAKPLPLKEWRKVEALGGGGVRVTLADGSLESTLKALDARALRLLGVVHVVAAPLGGVEAARDEIEILRRVHITTLSMCSGLDFLMHLHPADDLLGESVDPLIVGLRSHAGALCDEARRRGQRAISVGVATAGAATPAERRRAGASLSRLALIGAADATLVVPSPEAWPAEMRASSPCLVDYGGATTGDGSNSGSAIPLAVLRDMSSEERSERLRAIVDGHVAFMLSLQIEGRGAFDRDVALADFGLDSLTALELRLTLGKELGVELPLTALAERPSARMLGDIVCRSFAESLPSKGDGA